MALDPSIALNVRQLELPNQLAQYGQLAQIQNAQNQNAMAQYQLGAAQRQDAAQNALADVYKSAFNPETGAVDNAMVLKGLAERGAGHLIPDVQAKMLEAQQKQGLVKKTTLETSGLEFNQRIDKANKAISDIAALNTPDEALASIERHLANGDIDPQKAQMMKAQLAQAPSFGAWQKGMLTNILDAKEKLTMTAPKPTATNLGGKIVFLDLNPNSPTFQTEVVPSQKVEMTPGEKAVDARARERLAQEAQSVSIQTDSNGNFVAVPTKVAPGTVAKASAIAAPGAGLEPLKAKDASKTAVSEQQASYNIGRVLNAAKEINGVVKKDPSAIQPGGTEALASAVGLSGTANAARNANRQIVYGAQRDALDALLYLATGAAYNKEQLEGQMAAYIPSYTDEPENVAAKKARMAELIKSAKTRAGKAWTPEMENAMQSLTSPASAAAAPSTPAPKGVPADIWNNMTPEERKLWN